MFVVLTIICIEFYLYKKDMKNAYARLNQYNAKPLITSFGKMNYLDEGSRGVCYHFSRDIWWI